MEPELISSDLDVSKDEVLSLEARLDDMSLERCLMVSWMSV
jgi:hypothetical protein